MANNASVQMYVNRIKNKIVFKIKVGYKLEYISLKILKLLGSTKNDIDQNKDGENVPKLTSIEIVLRHCNLVYDNYQEASKVLLIFLWNKQFGQLINILPHSLTLLNTKNT